MAGLKGEFSRNKVYAYLSILEGFCFHTSGVVMIDHHQQVNSFKVGTNMKTHLLSIVDIKLVISIVCVGYWDWRYRASDISIPSCQMQMKVTNAIKVMFTWRVASYVQLTSKLKHMDYITPESHKNVRAVTQNKLYKTAGCSFQ